nr:glycosyltransferase family 64 protein c4 [Quercus suber]
MPSLNFAGKIYEIGSSGISSLKEHSEKRNKCLSDFVTLYGTIPLVSTNVKAVDARQEWFCDHTYKL